MLCARAGCWGGSGSSEVYLLSACVILQINAIPDFRTICSFVDAFGRTGSQRVCRFAHRDEMISATRLRTAQRQQTEIMFNLWQLLYIIYSFLITFVVRHHATIFAKMTRIPPTTAAFDNEFFLSPALLSTELANNLLFRRHQSSQRRPALRAQNIHFSNRFILGCPRSRELFCRNKICIRLRRMGMRADNSRNISCERGNSTVDNR